MADETIEGGCFCGALRYSIKGPVAHVVNCHCTMCRRTSGAPFVTWLVAPIQNFTYTQGTPKTLQSSEDGQRFFCETCGTPVACINGKAAEHVDITLGSLDHPEAYAPNMESFTDTKLAWVQVSVEN